MERGAVLSFQMERGNGTKRLSPVPNEIGQIERENGTKGPLAVSFIIDKRCAVF